MEGTNNSWNNRKETLTWVLFYFSTKFPHMWHKLDDFISWCLFFNLQKPQKTFYVLKYNYYVYLVDYSRLIETQPQQAYTKGKLHASTYKPDRSQQGSVYITRMPACTKVWEWGFSTSATSAMWHQCISSRLTPKQGKWLTTAPSLHVHTPEQHRKERSFQWVGEFIERITVPQRWKGSVPKRQEKLDGQWQNTFSE